MEAVTILAAVNRLNYGDATRWKELTTALVTFRGVTTVGPVVSCCFCS